ncbi:hypothetical protein GUI51_09440 [Enterococcus mundtii]|uniref:Uncharacterized protein n=1 Tax=Enterococcus mundtii TaxID=53346 RepID=A0ABQ0VH60_ENTMU|nr:hypothetical protein [Enterococcus mundtii]GEN18806.1 hypothetical protein LAC02_20870 [Ligilactobacillus acidipiscis]AUB52012.1 hypothetical protein EM4838_03030 [Enterococcus mundtii]MZZ58355.1 hypothetical protein [Enterococcus mundtii]MZZ61331.1 hypothetical protein [Enterococcus mundtii]MZZ68315.1 hypothetical protein [Enterococcus mundtii]
MLKIHVTNPYYEKTYKTDDINLDRWKNFIENHDNEEIIAFTDKLSGDYVVINPSNFASMQATEE